MMKNNPMRILLVDDQVLFRKALISLLAERLEFVVVGEAGSGREAVDLAHQLDPDLILMDIEMPEMNGLAATRKIKRELPHIEIIMLTVFDQDAKLFKAIKEGASGYLLKNIEPDELFEMLEKTQRGEAAINSIFATKILNEFSNLSKTENAQLKKHQLTPREMEVLECFVNGNDNKQIAEILSISPNTVKTHLENIMEKLHTRNRIETAIYAVTEGIVDYHAGGLE